MPKTNMPDAADFVPPEHLSDRARRLWCAVVPSRARSISRLALVQTALEALDRAEAARLAVESEGMTTKTETTGAVHVHPLVKVERESRAQFVNIWAGQLSMNFDQSVDGPDLEHFMRKMQRQALELLDVEGGA